MALANLKDDLSISKHNPNSMVMSLCIIRLATLIAEPASDYNKQKHSIDLECFCLL